MEAFLAFLAVGGGGALALVLTSTARTLEARRDDEARRKWAELYGKTGRR